MWEWIDATVEKFRKCFSRRATFNWFVIILIGLMVRSDHLGISSIVRELCLVGSAYTNMLHFFRSNAWFLGDIRYIWMEIVKSNPYLIKESGRNILVSDGVNDCVAYCTSIYLPTSDHSGSIKMVPCLKCIFQTRNGLGQLFTKLVSHFIS